MKKLTKALLMTALCLFIVGAAFCIVSVCIGFSVGDLKTAVDEGRFQLAGPSKIHTDVEAFIEDIASPDVDIRETYTDAESLDLEIGAAQCRIIPWDKDEWQVIGYHMPSGFSSRMKGDVLEITCERKGWRFWESTGSNTVLELYIPKEKLLNKVIIDAGVGEVGTEEGFLSCQKLELNCGVGECSINADIRKEAKISGGVGEVTLTLLGEEEDFDYDLECGIGEIILGGTKIEGLSGSQKIDNHSGRDIQIECGIGSVEILFEQQSATQDTLQETESRK